MPTVAEQREVALADRALALHPRVALRPEPFGALLYHYDTRRLVFLKHPDLVAVVRALSHHPSAADAIAAAGVAPDRRPGFLDALASLRDSGMLADRCVNDDRENGPS